jgi:hypothetical protein
MKLDFNNKFIRLIPEFVLVVITMIYWLSSSFPWNPIAIVLLLLLGLHIFINKPFTTVVAGSVFSLLSFYMLLAVLSDVVKITEFTSGQIRVYTIAFGLFCTSGVMAALIIWKFLQKMK